MLMADRIRLRYDGVATTLAAGIDADDTVLTFAAPLAAMGVQQIPSLGEDEYLVLVLNAEIVHLVSYVGGSMTGEVRRAQEGTLAFPHPINAVVEHSPTAQDFVTGHLHSQAAPATVWTIVHNLGFDPAGISVVSSDGYLAEGWGLQYLVPGRSLRLSFDIPISGIATLS